MLACRGPRAPSKAGRRARPYGPGAYLGRALCRSEARPAAPELVVPQVAGRLVGRSAWATRHLEMRCGGRRSTRSLRRKTRPQTTAQLGSGLWSTRRRHRGTGWGLTPYSRSAIRKLLRAAERAAPHHTTPHHSAPQRISIPKPLFGILSGASDTNAKIRLPKRSALWCAVRCGLRGHHRRPQ